MVSLWLFICRVSLPAPVKSYLLNIRQTLTQFGYRMKTFSARSVAQITSGELEQTISELTLNDLNRILFRCDSEERDDGEGFGAYVLDNYGSLKYCGLQGLLYFLQCQIHNKLIVKRRPTSWICIQLIICLII